MTRTRVRPSSLTGKSKSPRFSSCRADVNSLNDPSWTGVVHMASQKGHDLGDLEP